MKQWNDPASVPAIRLACAAILVALLPCSVLFGQTAPSATRLKTFYIHGTIRTHDGLPVPGAQVAFYSKEFNKVVFTDNKGFYKANLPVGLYTMTANALKPPNLRFNLYAVTPPQDPYQTGLEEYERPLFRVASQTALTLNVTLDPSGPTCDHGVPLSGQLPPQDDNYPICGGGRDLFPVPSDDNVSFGLLIRYRTRRAYERGYVYNAGRDWPGVVGTTPVFVAYNLFALRADHLVYDVKAGTLQATGNVVTVNFDGATHHAKSMAFKIENGQAFPVP